MRTSSNSQSHSTWWCARPAARLAAPLHHITIHNTMWFAYMNLKFTAPVYFVVRTPCSSLYHTLRHITIDVQKYVTLQNGKPCVLPKSTSSSRRLSTLWCACPAARFAGCIHQKRYSISGLPQARTNHVFKLSSNIQAIQKHDPTASQSDIRCLCLCPSESQRNNVYVK